MAARRRGRGEGSIYRRKDGRWVGQCEVGGKRRYVYGKTRKDVATRLAKAVADGNEGLIYDGDHLTLAQYLDRWMDSIRGTVRESTWVRHEINVRVHLKPALGKARLGKLDPLQVQSFYRCKLDEEQSPASVLKMHSTLSKALKQAVRWRMIPVNVCQAVVLPRITQPEIQPLDADQMKALLKAAKYTDLYALWALIFLPLGSLTAPLRAAIRYVVPLLGRWRSLPLPKPHLSGLSEVASITTARLTLTGDCLL
jgi:hypothetical protein